LLIAGFVAGAGDGDAAGVWAKEIDARANSTRAARGRYLFILGSPYYF
jgi:hypothetical protein